MDLDKLKELIGILEESGLSELEIEDDNQRVRLSKHAPVASYSAAVPAAQPAVPAGAPASAAEEESAEEEHEATIDSPMVGTFYSAPAPGEPPFVLPGSKIEPEQTVCIVEAMKIMNEVAGKEAVLIEKVLVENGQPVEFGQPLFAVRPLG